MWTPTNIDTDTQAIETLRSAERVRRQRLLNVTLGAIVIVAVPLLIGVLIAAPHVSLGTRQEVQAMYRTLVLGLIGALALYLVNRYLSVTWASVLFLLFLLVMAIVSDEPEQVANGRGLFLFALPIVAASFLLRPWASFVLAGLSSLVLAALAWYMGDKIPNIPSMLSFFVLAVITWIPARSLEHALSQVHTANQDLAGMIRQRTLLIQELHHRTKNNLQVIWSMLALQSSFVGNDLAQKALKAAQNRVQSMALAHEKLYQSQSLTGTRLDEYIRDLVGLLLSSHQGPDARVTVSFDLAPVTTLVDVVVPCGLVVNELIHNALEHAFAGAERGEIQISLRRVKPGEIALEVADNGVGYPDGFDPHSTETLGLQMVSKIIQDQLQGEAEFNTDDGARCRLWFRDDMYGERL